MSKVYIGTSGWVYPHWKGNFYPELKRGTSSAYPKYLPQKEWLKFYSQHFKTIEVNSSFYRQIKASTFEKWKSEVPDDFTFSIKGNRFITHIKRLRDVKDPVTKFFENTKPLANHQSPITNHHVILWQLPPFLKADVYRLSDFVKLLPRTFRHAFEFRHKSWEVGNIREVFKDTKKELAAVLQDWREWFILEEPIGNFVYLRLHGREQLYTSGYSNDELASWAKKMQKWISQGLDVYVYFNNDALGHAVENALTLKQLTSGN